MSLKLALPNQQAPLNYVTHFVTHLFRFPLAITLKIAVLDEMLAVMSNSVELAFVLFSIQMAFHGTPIVVPFDRIVCCLVSP